MFNFPLEAPHGVLIVVPRRNGQAVMHTQMWWVGDVWLWVWAVKEETWTGARWGHLGKWGEPQGRAQELSEVMAAVHSHPQSDTYSTETTCSKPLTSHPKGLRLREGKELARQTSAPAWRGASAPGLTFTRVSPTSRLPIHTARDMQTT